MSNAIRCINQRFAFKNSGILWLALIFNLSNWRKSDNPACKKSDCRLRNITSKFFCRLIQTHASVLKVSSSESSDMGPFQQSVKFLSRPRPLCVVLSPSVH